MKVSKTSKGFKISQLDREQFKFLFYAIGETSSNTARDAGVDTDIPGDIYHALSVVAEQQGVE